MANRTRYAGRKPDKAWLRVTGRLAWHLVRDGKLSGLVEISRNADNGLMGFRAAIGPQYLGWEPSHRDAMFLVEDALK